MQYYEIIGADLVFSFLQICPCFQCLFKKMYIFPVSLRKTLCTMHIIQAIMSQLFKSNLNILLTGMFLGILKRKNWIFRVEHEPV